MPNQIFALWGKANSGKSTTIACVVDELARHADEADIKLGYRRPSGPKEVWYAVLNIRGTLVGVTSPGDNAQIVDRRVKPLVAAGCRIIVCATHPAGGSVHALEQIAADARPPFAIEWIEKTSDDQGEEQNNRKTSKAVVAKVLKAIPNK